MDNRQGRPSDVDAASQPRGGSTPFMSLSADHIDVLDDSSDGGVRDRRANTVSALLNPVRAPGTRQVHTCTYTRTQARTQKGAGS